MGIVQPFEQTSEAGQFDFNDFKSSLRVFVFALVAVLLQAVAENVGKIHFGQFTPFIVPALVFVFKALQRFIAS